MAEDDMTPGKHLHHQQYNVKQPSVVRRYAKPQAAHWNVTSQGTPLQSTQV